MKLCEESINGIKFVYTASEPIASVRSALVSRLTFAKTIPGTRGYHQLEPLTYSTIKIKHISYDDNFELKFDFLQKKTHLSNAKTKNIKLSQYLLWKHGRFYWINIASETDPSTYSIKVKFMHPNYPSQSFRWPMYHDACWVLHTHLIMTINIPSLSSASRHQYHISPDDIEVIESLIQV